MSTRHRMGIAVLLAMIASPVDGQDLTGIWRDDRGGRYVMRQAAEEFCWYSESNVFCGIITGPVIAGSWLDLPTGRFRGNGRLVIHIESQNRLVKLNQAGSYGASVWTREGTSPPPETPSPRPQPAPPPPLTPPSSNQPTGGPRPATADIVGGLKTWDYRGVGGDYNGMTGKLIEFSCDADPSPTEWRGLYGTDIYTDDSLLCQAALHAGVITTRGGKFTIEILPGQPSYTGSRRNGVISADYPKWSGSFAFRTVRVDYDVSRDPQPSSVPRVDNTIIAELNAGRADTPQNFGRQIGARIRYTCAPRGEYLNRVWGTDVYTLDSEICVAAMHAGLITAASGGKVVVEIRPGENSYRGSLRNGVTSGDYTAFPVSYVFVR